MTAFDGCPCSGVNLSRLLQPAIMTILAGNRLHGYAVVERLARTAALAGARPDPTGVYRVLSAMEERGLVTASWDTSRRGPAKKIYNLTLAGGRCLLRWVSSLSDYHRAIGDIIADARKAAGRLHRSHQEDGR